MKCKSMNYAWGRQGASSLVTKILTQNSLPFDNNKPYAEYWMGTHINGPSEVYTEKQFYLQMKVMLKYNMIKIKLKLKYLYIVAILYQKN